MSHWSESLLNVNGNRACSEAIEWCATQPSLEVAWKNCEYGDWLLWLIGRTTKSEPWSEERKPLAMVAAECAMLAPPCRNEDYELARIWCIDALTRWCDGEDNREEVEAAQSAAAYASSAAYASAASASADAAYADASAAYAAADAARDADAADAADAASSAAYASSAAAAAADATRNSVRKDAAKIVRRRFPAPPWW